MPSKFLFCGLVSSIIYIVLNIVCPLNYPGYSWVSQTVSELSAIGAPTRPLWFYGALVYQFFVLLFAWGVLKSAGGSKPLRMVGLFLILNSIVSLFWPPMHQRTALAMGEGSLTDILHIVFTMITVPLMMLIIGFGAASQGTRFKLYSVVTLFILITAGIFTGKEAPNIDKNMPTPWIGVWERINIGVYMLWIAVFSFILWREENVYRQSKGTQRGFA